MIHYRINPANSGSSLTSQQIVGAIIAGTATWMQADGVVQFVYDGTTTATPGTSVTGSFNNVVGFVPGTASGGQGVADLTPNTGNCTHYTAFDIRIAAGSWDWSPCDPAQGTACSPTDPNFYDLEADLTHEWGHVEGLGHPVVQGHDDSQLTMVSSSACPGCRFADTLGYGDVLGVRSLYSTSAPLPTLYDP